MSNILIVPLSAKIAFDNNQAGSNTINPLSAGTSMELMYNGEGGVTFTSKSSASDRFSVEGINGNLFSVTDSLTGTIFSVNDISGLPIIEVISDETADVVKMGTIGTDAFVLSSDKLGIGTAIPGEKLTVAGNISASGNISVASLTANGKIIGGINNTANGTYAAVIGGTTNTASGSGSFVGGGGSNTASGNCSTLVGGVNNCAIGTRSFVGGGTCNTACDNFSIIVGGFCGLAYSGSFIGGGTYNQAIGKYSFIGGGSDNRANGCCSTVAGGFCNTAATQFSFVGGGSYNKASGLTSSTVGGGCCNTACGFFSGILGGRNNIIQVAHQDSFIIGSNLTSNAACTTFVNNLSAQGNIYGAELYDNGNRVCTTAEADTLQSVTNRGFTTTNSLSVASLTATGKIIGGYNNTANGDNAAVIGGTTNTASGSGSFVGGGYGNTASGTGSVVAGGGNDYGIYGVRGNTASGNYSFVGGGAGNYAIGNYSFVGGGGERFPLTMGGNYACGSHSVIVGGAYNVAGSYSSFVGGGRYNCASGFCSVVAGGSYNGASGNYSFVGGGQRNRACGNRSVVAGGYKNCAIGTSSVVAGGGGGYYTCNVASGNCSGILGGHTNTIQAAHNDSFIIGSNLTSNAACTTFVNNLSAQCNIYGAELGVNGDANIDGTLTVDKISLSDNSFIVETGSFTLSDSHKGATVLLQNTAAITITIPALSTGHTTSFITETANTVTFQAGTGLSGLNSFGNANQIAGIFGQAQILYKTSNYAFLGGNIS